MSFNGSGTFLINSAGQPVVTGTVISSTAFNALTNDLATGLSTTITKDGQTSITANIPWGGYKITNLGAGTAATDAAQLQQVQSSTAKLITVTGTDSIIGSLSPALTTYSAGQMFYFVAAGTNTTAVTINIDGLGVKNITHNGNVALAAGDILSGEMIVIVYDGTRFQMVSPANSFGTIVLGTPLAVNYGGTGATTLAGANIPVTNATNTFTATQTFSVPAEFDDGTASAPTVTNVGDTNTGIYFPAADQVAITTGGTVAAAFNSNGLFFRNRIINGDMRIDQRNAGAAVTINSAANTYTLDRWNGFGQAADGVFTVTQSSVAPAGFVNSALVTVTTADASLGATQTYSLNQPIEGTNVADLNYGTASAATVTVSFWVRSSVTGTFGGAVTNSAGNRAYPFTFAISAANTWEQKSVTIAGDTTGTWLTTTGIGLYLRFSLGAGSSVSAAAGAWTSTANVVSATGATNLMATNGATLYLTGVQLETGSVATPFERRPFGTELLLCQRYYCKTMDLNVAAAAGNGQNGSILSWNRTASTASGTYQGWWSFPVTMRAAPTVTTFNPGTAGQTGWYDNGAANITAAVANPGTQGVSVYNTGATSVNTNGVIHLVAAIEL